MTTLETVIKRSNNNFDLIRLIAALMVIFGHSFDLFNSNGYYDPVKAVVKESSGTLAVYIFFFMSGIFITGSFINKKDHTSFIQMRVFRIWPALIACTLLAVFFIGVILTTLPLKQYIGNPDTWKFLFSNILLYNVTSHRLPGLFIANHFGSAVNGSLWTLPFEVKCYCIVFISGLAGFLRSKTFIVSFFLVLVFTLVLQPNYLTVLGGKLVLFFTAGMLLYIYKHRFLVDYRISLLLIISCFCVYGTWFFQPLFYLALPYTALVLGASSVFKKIKLPGDYSYGIYIYGFLIQQVLANLFPGLNSYYSLLLTLPIVIPLGILSWHLIEYPAIEYGKKLQLFRQQ